MAAHALHDAWADITSTLLHLPLRPLTRILADDPGAWQDMGRLMVQKLRIALSLLEDMALEPPRVRLTRCLINLFEGYGERKAEPSTRVRVSQERLGTMLSLSRQTVNELLRDLERELIIQCQRGGSWQRWIAALEKGYAFARLFPTAAGL